MAPNSATTAPLAFGVQWQSKELLESISGSLTEKGYTEEEFGLSKPELRYEPYYFFHYDALQPSAPPTALKESESEEESEEGVELEGEMEPEGVGGVASGATALHAIRKEFNDDIASLLEEFEPEPTHAKKLPKPLFSLEEVKRIASIHLASRLNVQRADVEISALQLV